MTEEDCGRLNRLPFHAASSPSRMARLYQLLLVNKRCCLLDHRIGGNTMCCLMGWEKKDAAFCHKKNFLKSKTIRWGYTYNWEILTPWFFYSSCIQIIRYLINFMISFLCYYLRTTYTSISLLGYFKKYIYINIHINIIWETSSRAY